MRNEGLFAVYLDSLNFTSGSCDNASVSVRRLPLSSEWPRTKKLCSSTGKKVLGYLGSGFSFRIELKTKDTPQTEFRLRFERELVSPPRNKTISLQTAIRS